MHQLILNLNPTCKIWFFDGKYKDNKKVSNPTIGYGELSLNYANGSITDWFQIGVSANKLGISIYILDIKDKTYLSQNFGREIGKAFLTSYCIKFKTLKDLHLNILEKVILFGFVERI
ncbi:MAG: DUF1801 domain-containing protein [Bacteroidia bacterium]